MLGVVHVQVVVHRARRRLHARHGQVVAVVGRLVGAEKVAVHHTPVLIVRGLAPRDVAVQCQGGQHFVRKDSPVVLVHQTIAKDALALVRPQDAQRVGRLDLRRRTHENAGNDARRVAHVKDVVRARRRRTQLGLDAAVQCHRGGDEARVARAHHGGAVVARLGQDARDDGLKDGPHDEIGRFGNADETEEAREAPREHVAPAVRRAHGPDGRNALDGAPVKLAAVVPSATPKHLADELDDGHRAVRVLAGHVDVVDEEDDALARRRRQSVAALARLELRAVGLELLAASAEQARR